ncbi:MAG: polymorphic toxin type 23 domain-containing protein [Bacteroidota bacterium]
MGLKIGDFGFRYENDDGPPFDIFHNKIWAGGTDQFRTTAVSVSYKEFSIGLNLFTGNRDYDGPVSEPYTDEYGQHFPHGAVETPGANKYRLGAFYASYNGNRFGINSERVRHLAQNKFAHGLLAPQAYFKNMSWTVNSYYQYQSPNPFTLW